MEKVDYDVYGKFRYKTEEQCTHLCIVIEAYSEDDAMNKARVISDKVIWISASKHSQED